MAPRVSAVVINCNYGRFLPDALDSVLGQDFPSERTEIVVVDDGSTDDSREVLARYAGRVRAHLQDNAGAAAALNAGLALAAGDIVCLLDADDAWRPAKLSRVVELFDRGPDLAAVQHLLQKVDARLQPLPTGPTRWPARYVLDDYVEGRVVFSPTSGLAFRREALKGALPIPLELRTAYFDDYLLVGALANGPIGNISERLGCHRTHGANNYLGVLGDVRKLETEAAMRAAFQKSRAGLLSARGRALSPRFERLERFEHARRAVLASAQSGRRGEAARAWSEEWRRASLPFERLRALALALALVSPSVYLGLHRVYARVGALRRAREALFPNA